MPNSVAILVLVLSVVLYVIFFRYQLVIAGWADKVLKFVDDNDPVEQEHRAFLKRLQGKDDV